MKALLFVLAFVFFGPSMAASRVVAGIEIGSKGVKAIAVEVDQQPGSDEYDLKSVYKRQINPNLIADVSADGFLQEGRIADTKKAVAELYSELQKKDPQFIVVVASTAFEKIKNRAALSAAIKEATNQDLKYIVADEEMYYGLVACIPEKMLGSSMLIDIGSGNSKMGYSSASGSPNGFESRTISYGTVTLKQAGAAAGAAGIESILAKEVIPQIRAAAKENTGLSSEKRRMFVIGGAAWAAANLARPQDIEKPYVYLKQAELQALGRKLSDGSFVFKSDDPKAKQEASRIFDVFSMDDLKAGVNLLASMTGQLNGERRSIVFPRQGAEGGWLYGYMFAKYNASLAAVPAPAADVRLSPTTGGGNVVAGIEVGAKGIKAIAVEVTEKSNSGEYSVKSVYKRQITANLLSDVSPEGYLQEARIMAGANAVSELYKELQARSPRFIVIVASTAFEKVQNKPALSLAVKEAVNEDLNYIVADEEMYYGLLACVPQRLLATSMLIDIGSGNAKMGYASAVGAKGFESLTIPFGTITLKEAGAKVGATGVDDILKTQVTALVRKAVQDKPGIASPQRRIFVIGGAAWAAANLSRPQDIDNAYVTLNTQEIQSLTRQLSDSGYTLKSDNSKAQLEAGKIFDVFTRDDLRSGVGLLSTVLTELNGSKRAVIFPRVTAEGGWLYGYMFAKYNAR